MANTKNLMKHIAIILAVLAAVFFLGSCGSPKPTESADTFLKAIKEKNMESLASVYAGTEFDILSAASGESSVAESEDTALAKVTEEQLVPKMLDFDYEISNEQIDGDKATVDVKISTYPIGDAFTSFFSDYISQAFVLAFSDVSEEELDAMASTLLSGKVADLTEKSYEKTATLSLTKTDGKWIVDQIEPAGDFVNALTGGLASSFGSMEDAFSGLNGEQ